MTEVNETIKFLRELHKENSLFLNKALLAIPAVSAPVLLGFLSQKPCWFASLLIVLGAISFTISVLVLLYACFLSEEAINELTDGDVKKSEQLNNKIKKHNKTAFWFVVLGFILAFTAILIIFIIPINFEFKEKNIMSDSKKTNVDNAHIEKVSVQGGASIPVSCYDGFSLPSNAYAAKKGLTIPQSALNNSQVPVSNSQSTTQPGDNGKQPQSLSERK